MREGKVRREANQKMEGVSDQVITIAKRNDHGNPGSGVRVFGSD